MDTNVNEKHMAYTYAHFIFCRTIGFIALPTTELDADCQKQYDSEGANLDRQSQTRTERINRITEKALANELEIQ